jgi:hypothetical protein
MDAELPLRSLHTTSHGEKLKQGEWIWSMDAECSNFPPKQNQEIITLVAISAQAIVGKRSLGSCGLTHDCDSNGPQISMPFLDSLRHHLQVMKSKSIKFIFKSTFQLRSYVAGPIGIEIAAH